MKFADLYHYANTQLDGDAVPLKELQTRIQAFHGSVGKVEFWPVELDRTKSLGHIKYERDRSSPYDDAFTVVSIRYDKTLTRCWRRFVCCKELMHVFDTNPEKVDTRDKFFRLMKELETPPLFGDQSPMYASELRAQWMAVFCLVPERLRNKYKMHLNSGSIDEYSVALKLKIPLAYVKAISSEYYDIALQRLLSDPDI